MQSDGYHALGGPSYENQASCFNTRNRETLYISCWAAAPQFEAKSDREIVETLAGKLGLDTAALFPYTTEEVHAYRIANATVVQEDGETYGPLVTITQEDIDRLGVKGLVLQEDKISWDEIVANGIYHVARKEGDNLGWIAYEDFRRDPEGNPRASASGKIELFCQAKTDMLDRLGFVSESIPPYATYLRPLHGYEDSFEDWEAKKKGAYPLQVFNSHYLRRAHSAFDTNVWLREAFKSPVFMNAADAAERGIENGAYPAAKMHSYSRTCNHCASPACVANCPTGAMYQADDGTVQHNDAECIGCQTCVNSCPYGIPQYDEEQNISRKCDSCKAYRDAGMNPVCVDACCIRVLFQRPTLEVRRSYRAAGFAPLEGHHVADDHLSLELGFMAALAGRALEGAEQEDEEAQEAALVESVKFLAEHLRCWLDDYATALAQEADAGFYAHAARAAADFVEADYRWLTGR